ncbi:G2/mitotic-specific cyclin S13-7 [Cajanus cajan]|uniref:G2/mitotic-specific cyclin S13-7 n=1 Tax=Cajanus cajan TaxID=3821 RepID=UPI00098D7DED|nr:G2/mitotic-specific cyclin S13-7 [Cajanus cajan]
MGREKGKAKNVEDGQGCRQVLGDIGNLEVPRITEGKLISKPFTRNLHTKLSENELSQEDPVLVLDVHVNEQGAAQGNKSVIVPTLDKEAIVHQEHGAEDFFRKPNLEPVAMASSEAGEREASGVLIEAEYEPFYIDVNDPHEVAVAEYFDDIYRFLKLAELETGFRASDYMNSQHDINEIMRSIVVDFLVDAHMRFHLVPETLFLTVNIFDRYLSSTIVPKEEILLLSISSMLIACKYEEMWTTPKVSDFISITDNAYSRNQILSMEKDILMKLEWKLSVPTSYVFIVTYIRAFNLPDKQMENMVFFLAELGLANYRTAISLLPSMLAAAAVYAARFTLNRNPIWNEILKNRAGYTTQKIRDCAKLLVRLLSNAPNSNTNTLYQKFCSIDRGGVAYLTPPNDFETHL